VDDAAVRVEHFDEAAHVRAFEMMRQIHEHPDGRNRVLKCARLVAHLNRKAQPAHADLVNAQFARVAFILLVVQKFRRFASANSRHGKSVAVLPHLAKMFS
jgi:hypothetical protein